MILTLTVDPKTKRLGGGIDELYALYDMIRRAGGDAMKHCDVRKHARQIIDLACEKDTNVYVAKLTDAAGKPSGDWLAFVLKVPTYTNAEAVAYTALRAAGAM